MTGSFSTLTLPESFPVLRCRLSFTVQDTIRWPDYEGSTLRGLFGRGLRKVACVTGKDDCAACPQAAGCAYRSVFDPLPPPSMTGRAGHLCQPYVIEPSLEPRRILQPNDTYQFDHLLFGSTSRWLSLVLLGWREALSLPIGGTKGRASLTTASLLSGPNDAAIVMDQNGPRVPAQLPQEHHSIALKLQEVIPESVNITFQTPLRLKRDGKLVNEKELDSPDILLAVARRVTETTTFYSTTKAVIDYPQVRSLCRGITIKKGPLKWQSVQRWSNRKNQNMSLSGIVGQVNLKGNLEPFWSLLRFAEILHIGGKATFGLGRYRLDW